MKAGKNRLCLFLVAGLCAFAPLRGISAQSLSPKTEKKIRSILSSPQLKEAHAGLSVLDLGPVKDANSFPAKPFGGKPFRVLFEYDAQKKFMPASNMKLFTAAIALQLLGKEKTFPTRAWLQDGSLILYGGGDPSLKVSGIQEIAKQVAARSKQKIKLIIGDGSAYIAETSDGRYPDGWTIDDARWYYGPEIGALAIERNHVDVRVTGAGEASEPAKVEIDSPLAKLIRLVPPKVQTGSADLKSQSDDDLVEFAWREQPLVSNDIAAAQPGVLNPYLFQGVFSSFQSVSTTFLHVTGQVAPHQEISQGVPFPNPSLMAAMVLGDELRRKGVELSGIVGSGRYSPLHPPADSDLIARYDSPPLRILLQRLLQNSDNLYAEMLLRNTAYYYDGTGSNKAGPHAHELLKKWLSTQNIDTSALRFEDGSGLSRYNLLTPRATAELLAAINRMPEGAAIWNALPVAGVDGTLKNRMRYSPAMGSVRAKTGTFSIASNLSGYVTTRDKRRLAVACYVNFARDTQTAQWAQDEIFKALAIQGAD